MRSVTCKDKGRKIRNWIIDFKIKNLLNYNLIMRRDPKRRILKSKYNKKAKM